MSEEEIRKMCSDIYEGEYWQPMIDLVQSKDKEIKSLKQALKDTLESSKIIENEQKEENERLNNIINELEKELFIKKEFYERELTIRPKNDSEYNTQYADSCALAQICVIYDKLQELKGSDKE